MLKYKSWYLLPSGNIFKIESISLDVHRFFNMINTEEYIAVSTEKNMFLNTSYRWKGIDSEKEIIQEIKRVENG
jgi:hypothetical protein